MASWWRSWWSTLSALLMAASDFRVDLPGGCGVLWAVADDAARGQLDADPLQGHRLPQVVARQKRGCFVDVAEIGKIGPVLR